MNSSFKNYIAFRKREVGQLFRKAASFIVVSFVFLMAAVPSGHAQNLVQFANVDGSRTVSVHTLSFDDALAFFDTTRNKIADISTAIGGSIADLTHTIINGEVALVGSVSGLGNSIGNSVVGLSHAISDSEVALVNTPSELAAAVTAGAHAQLSTTEQTALFIYQLLNGVVDAAGSGISNIIPPPTAVAPISPSGNHGGGGVGSGAGVAPGSGAAVTPVAPLLPTGLTGFSSTEWGEIVVQIKILRSLLPLTVQRIIGLK